MEEDPECEETQGKTEKKREENDQNKGEKKAQCGESRGSDDKTKKLLNVALDAYNESGETIDLVLNSKRGLEQNMRKELESFEIKLGAYSGAQETFSIHSYRKQHYAYDDAVSRGQDRLLGVPGPPPGRTRSKLSLSGTSRFQ